MLFRSVNFILQEAHEKANEIRVKTEHDFNLEKQTIVHQAKTKVNEEFVRKERDRAVQQRISRSNAITESRNKKMFARDAMLQEFMKDATSRIDAITKRPKYPKLLKDLVVQGVRKLDNEVVVMVHCRPEDVGLMEKIIPEAEQELKGKKKGISIKLSPKNLPSEIIPNVASGPGVVVPSSLFEPLAIRRA